MIDKKDRTKLLNLYTKKEDKIFAGYIIDQINKLHITDHLIHTNFLDLNEQNIAISILNALKENYLILDINEDLQRKVIFLIPSYMNDVNKVDIFNKYISCLKITPYTKGKLAHKNYMGAIYSSGFSEDMLGDIFCINDTAYLFTFKNCIEYFLSNLLTISKVEVKLEELSLDNNEIFNIKLNFKSLEIIIPSLRIDVILSSLYNLSRKEVKQKIENGDLIINSKEMFFVAYNVQNGDIISFRKFGKAKVVDVIRKTKNENLVLHIKKYI